MVQERGAGRLAPGVAFQELGGMLLGENSMETVLQRVADLASQVVLGATAVSVTIFVNGKASTIVHSGEIAFALDQTQYAAGEGPCLAAAEDGVIHLVEDWTHEQRWPALGKAAITAGILSSLAVPIMIDTRTTASLNLYGQGVDAFDDHSRELAAAFSGGASVAIANMHLYDATVRLNDQMSQALGSRAVIDQARGVLMSQQRCSAEEAFDLLVSASQRTNTKLRDIAQQIVDNASKR